MGALGYKLFPSLAKERDKLVADRELVDAVSRQVAKEAADAYHRIVALNDELAAMTLRATSAEAKLAQMHRPAPLEPATIKVGTAADVRRIVEQQNFRDEQENSDGIR